jgi:SAM-dependent methyltransferase
VNDASRMPEASHLDPTVLRADSAWLTSVVVCPACLAPGVMTNLREDSAFQYFQCPACHRVYPVDRNGVVDFQPIDLLLDLPEGALEMWALAQSRSIDEYRARDPGSIASSERGSARAFGRFIDVDGAKVLDVGGGTDYVPAYVQAHQLAQYVGLDPLPAEQLIPFTKVRAWAEFMPFADASFDALLCGTSLDHVLGLDQAVGELGRVLRPGGTLYLWTALFVDSKWFGNLLPNTLFERRHDASGHGLHQYRADADRLQERIGNVQDLEERFSHLLVDKWHFRHLPVSFVKQLVDCGFAPRKMEVWEHNYHEGSVFLNVFLALENRGTMDAVALEIDRQLGMWAMLARLTESVAIERQEGAIVRDAVAGVRLHTELAREEVRAGSARLEAISDELKANSREDLEAVKAQLDSVMAQLLGKASDTETLLREQQAMIAALRDQQASTLEQFHEVRREQAEHAAALQQVSQEQTQLATMVESINTQLRQIRLAPRFARLLSWIRGPQR